MIPYKYSQLVKRMTYEDAKKRAKWVSKNLHLGQLKLFFTELFFLTMHAKDGNKILYVGAANGYHIGKLAELFPKLSFDLWDPGKFEVKSSNNIKIYNKFFTDETANQYVTEGSNILFICDIRTLKIKSYTKNKENEKIDELISDDMQMQEKWVQIIKPIYAYLKFRLPYSDKKFKYLQGPIYLQPYVGLSTETRLMTNNYFTYIEYDSLEYDEKIAYFNFFTRQEVKSIKWAKLMDKYNVYNIWDNIFALYITQFYLKQIKNFNSKKQTFEFFLQIVQYFIDRYGEKYDVIFNESKK